MYGKLRRFVGWLRSSLEGYMWGLGCTHSRPLRAHKMFLRRFYEASTTTTSICMPYGHFGREQAEHHFHALAIPSPVHHTKRTATNASQENHWSRKEMNNRNEQRTAHESNTPHTPVGFCPASFSDLVLFFLRPINRSKAPFLSICNV